MLIFQASRESGVQSGLRGGQQKLTGAAYISRRPTFRNREPALLELGLVQGLYVQRSVRRQSPCDQKKPAEMLKCLWDLSAHGLRAKPARFSTRTPGSQSLICQYRLSIVLPGGPDPEPLQDTTNTQKAGIKPPSAWTKERKIKPAKSRKKRGSREVSVSTL